MTFRARPLRLATRGSPLALLQSEKVAALLARLPGSPRCELVVVHTTGDRLPDAEIESIGGQGAFVKEVSAAVLDGRADVAVHSAKDLPSVSEPGLTLAAVPERIDPRDALVGSALEDLPAGSVVATGSVRRRAQIAWLRPDLTFCNLRGNMARRLERAKSVGAGVLAMAALERLGLSDHVAEVFEPAAVLPQVGQGALALECRSSDEVVAEMLESIDDPVAHAAISAERSFLAQLGGGCSLPCGALATPWASVPGDRSGDGSMVLEGVLASRDGHLLVRRCVEGEEPVALGVRLASELLDHAGGRAIEDWSAQAEVIRAASEELDPNSPLGSTAESNSDER